MQFSNRDRTNMKPLKVNVFVLAEFIGRLSRRSRPSTVTHSRWNSEHFIQLIVVVLCLVNFASAQYFFIPFYLLPHTAVEYTLHSEFRRVCERR